MEGESREPSDAGVVGRRVGSDGAQGRGFAPGVGAGGDAVVDRGGEKLVEFDPGMVSDRRAGTTRLKHLNSARRSGWRSVAERPLNVSSRLPWARLST